MTIEERIESIIRRVKDGVTENDLRVYLRLCLDTVYEQGYAQAEREYEE